MCGSLALAGLIVWSSGALRALHEHEAGHSPEETATHCAVCLAISIAPKALLDTAPAVSHEPDRSDERVAAPDDRTEVVQNKRPPSTRGPPRAAMAPESPNS